ncbi:MAG TPA: FAD-dependent monooxygenase, partial [Acidimicrobiia bacterium]
MNDQRTANTSTSPHDSTWPHDNTSQRDYSSPHDSTSLRGLRVLIVGAGIAGPALAHWLSRYGATATVVEIAPALRTSGFAVDFRGPTHLGILAKMGVLDDLRAIRTHGGAMSCVDKNGSEIF